MREGARAASEAKPIAVKVVVVSMFEIGEDQGDTAGEFQLWKERQKATERLPFAHQHDLYMNPETGVLLLLTGMGSINSASAVMELGMDPRFDLSKAYWVVAGIAGVDPENASIGSRAWAEWLVDGDLSHEIDPREMPKDWSTGYLPLDTTKPYDPKRPPSHGEVFQLNPTLVNWAYERTKDIALPDSPDLQKERARYKDFPNAQKPPFVLKGDNLAAMTFWHGKILNEWAREVGGLLDRRQGRVRHLGDGRHRHLHRHQLSRAHRQGGQEPRAGAAHGQQLHHAAAGAERRGSPAAGERRLCGPAGIGGIGLHGGFGRRG